MFSPIIKTDESRLQQVLLNLQSNAIKFTEKGKVQIVVQITRGLFADYDENDEDDLQLYLQVQVIDTGVGINDEIIDKLFEPFGYIDDGKQLNS